MSTLSKRAEVIASVRHSWATRGRGPRIRELYADVGICWEYVEAHVHAMIADATLDATRNSRGIRPGSLIVTADLHMLSPLQLTIRREGVEAVAERVGVTIGTVHKWRKGGQPAAAASKRLRRAFGPVTRETRPHIDAQRLALESSAPPRTFGELIRLERLRLNLAQWELAQATRLTTRVITRAEQGRQIPKPFAARRICDALGLPVTGRRAWGRLVAPRAKPPTLRHAYTRLALGKRDLARLAGVDRAAVANADRGIARPSTLRWLWLAIEAEREKVGGEGGC